MNNKQEKPNYLGHRSRLRNRYLKTGINSLAEHEILELILFPLIPRIDTKPIAYKLIKHFGNLNNVLSSSIEALIDAGVTENCAIHISLYSTVPNWLIDNKVAGKVMKDYDEIGKHLQALQANDKVERLIALLLDTQNRLIDTVIISKGTFSSTAVEMRTLTSACMQKNCAKIILSHNHPRGSCQPSSEDLSVTDFLENFLHQLDIKLVEHYIITETDYIGINYYKKEQKRYELQNLHKM